VIPVKIAAIQFTEELSCLIFGYRLSCLVPPLYSNGEILVAKGNCPTFSVPVLPYPQQTVETGSRLLSEQASGVEACTVSSSGQNARLQYLTQSDALSVGLLFC